MMNPPNLELENVGVSWSFLATLLGEEVPKSFGVDSAELKMLVVFLLFCNLNAADILENEVLMTRYRYCGRSMGEVGTTNWALERKRYITVVN
jgi:hypothetical protein